MAAQEDLFATLDKLGIAHETVEHAPIFTAAEGLALRIETAGLHCKNLFLKNKKGQIWLVVLPSEKRADLVSLEKKLGGGRLSFGKPDLLLEILGITPGSVTPFALLNDSARRVTVVLDCDLMRAEWVSCHPLRNDASTTLRAEDLLKFIKSLGYEPLLVDCGSAEKAANSEK
jgi:Ala-tRNA(Pro) deacylase